MPDRRVTQLPELSDLQDDDELYAIDRSETNPANRSKRVSVANTARKVSAPFRSLVTDLANRVDAEVAKRAAGDQVQGINVASASQYQTTLNAQANADTALALHVTADISGSRNTQAYTWNRGDVLYFSPRSDSAERLFNIGDGVTLADNSVTKPKLSPEVRTELESDTGLKARNYYLGDVTDSTPVRIYQQDGTPGITAVTDLDGDYILVIKNPSAMISGAVVGNEDRIDELRIFITNGGLSQVVHRVDPYTWTSESQVIAFNISDAEESSVVASITENYVEFTIAPYVSNGAVGTRLMYRLPIVADLETNTAMVGRLVEQRVLVDVPASDATVDKLIVEDSQLYTTETVVVHQTTAQQVAFENIRFDLGYFSDESALDPQFYRVGRFYYNFARYTPRVVAYVSGNSGPKRWIDGVASDLVANITADIGHFPSDALASPQIQAVGNVYYNERLRVYRRATEVTQGSGTVTAEQRLRQANVHDLARIDSQFTTVGFNRLEFVVTAAPTSIDVHDMPRTLQVTTTSERNKWVANVLRITVLGRITNVTYNPESRNHSVTIPVTPQMQANARLIIQDGASTTRLHAEILQDNVTLASTYFDLSVKSGNVGELEQLTDDLRVAAVPSWQAATGTGVGIAISSTFFTDFSTLTFAPTATVPSDAAPGDAIYYYIAIPTDANPDDWRLSLNAQATFDLSDLESTSTIGGNTVYVQEFGVGDGSGGFQSGTAPGAIITLQQYDHHTTAFGGELEGRALEQVRTEGGGSSGGGRRAFGPNAGQIATWAEGNNAAALPDAKIPAGVSRNSEVATAIMAEATARENADNALGTRIDAKQDASAVPTWVTDPSVEIPVGKLAEVLASDSVIINDRDGTVAPTAQNRDRVRYHDRKFYYNEPTHYTDPSATYRNLAAGDLTAGYSVLGSGVFQVTPNLSGVANNAVWYSIPAGHWNRKITFGGRATAAYWNPNFTWRGYFANESDADAHVRAVNDVVIFGGQARWVTSYTPRTPDEFRWSLLFDTEYVLAQLPQGQAGDYLRWTGSTWAPTSIPQLATQALTFAANIAMAVGQGYVGTVTLTGNTVFTISGGADGDVADLLVTQDRTGGRTLSLAVAVRRYAGQPTPALTGDAGAIDSLLFRRVAGNWYFVGQRRVA